MVATVKTSAAAALVALTASMASAVPANTGQLPEGLSSDIVRVHGGHRSCQQGQRGLHRHDQFGARIPCREDRPPRSCVKEGRDWYCDSPRY
jgi:hypothetical protein